MHVGTEIKYLMMCCVLLKQLGFQRLQNIINVYTYGHTPNGTVYTIEL